MPKLKQRLDELLQEDKARVEAHKVRSAAVRSADIAVKKKKIKNPERKELERWREKRARWVKQCAENPGYEAMAGEAANILDGLTPDGYDRKGRKVSFVERGKSLAESGRVSSKPALIGRK